MTRTLILSAASVIALSGAAAAMQHYDTSIRREDGVGLENADYVTEGSAAAEEGHRQTIQTGDMDDDPVVRGVYHDGTDSGMHGVQHTAGAQPVMAHGPKPGAIHDEAARVVEWEEMFESRLQQAFNAIDTNGNAMISRQEWGSWQADDGFYAARFNEFDRNGDDAIAWTEYWNATSALYDVSGLTTSGTAG